MSNSLMIQVGKAGEHLVCADLIMKGYNAMLADQGSAYDIIIISEEGKLCRIQVKSTLNKIMESHLPYSCYSFTIKYGHNNKGTGKVIPIHLIDMLAFVALDTKKIAYLSVADLTNKKNDGVIRRMRFLEGEIPAVKRHLPGEIRYSRARRIEDYSDFTFFESREEE